MNIFYQNCFEYSKLSVSLHPQLHADMVKLVDMPDLGSGAARRVGSSPIIRTKAQTKVLGFFCGIRARRLSRFHREGLLSAQKKLLKSRSFFLEFID